MNTYRFFTLFDRSGRYYTVVSGNYDVIVLPTLEDWDGYHFEGEFDDSYYFFEGEPVKRPENTTTLNDSKLSNVPPNSTIHIDSDTYECKDGGTVGLSFNLHGTYIVRVASFPHLDKEFTIDYQP